MPNFTTDDYKEAVRNKYDKQKEGIYSNYLSSPSQANLRDLCWNILKSSTNPDDLNVYSEFCKFEFDFNNENISTTYTDKFKKVGDFLKREKEPAKISTVDLAAILVDFQPRPFGRFRKLGLEKEGLTNEVVKSDSNEREKYKQEENLVTQFVSINNKPQNVSSNTTFERIKRFLKRLFNRSKSTMAGVTIIFSLIGVVIYFAFFTKQCMQWTGNHYERVDCVQETNDPVGFNTIKPFDKIQFELKKINVCDTTTCFKNEQAIIWYGKINNQVDFFNMNGLNPLNGKPLRPITNHMFHKYKGDCKTKKSGSAQ